MNTRQLTVANNPATMGAATLVPPITYKLLLILNTTPVLGSAREATSGIERPDAVIPL
jgi:hypothetical protein